MDLNALYCQTLIAKEYNIKLSWAKLITIGNCALLKLGLSLAIQVPHNVDMRSTCLVD